jgi:hypothetical protein
MGRRMAERNRTKKGTKLIFARGAGVFDKLFPGAGEMLFDEPDCAVYAILGVCSTTDVTESCVDFFP